MITYILERLAVGSISDARRVPDEISAMLNVAEELDYGDAERQSHKVALKDMSPIPPHALAESIQWLWRNIPHNCILIYCNAGIGRSPSVAAAFLCSMGFGYDEAVRFVGGRLSEFSPVPNLVQSVEDCIHFYL